METPFLFDIRPLVARIEILEKAQAQLRSELEKRPAIAPSPLLLKAYLTPREVWQLTGIPVATLADWRHSGLRGLPFVKDGRLIRYETKDVVAYMESNKRKTKVI